MNGEEQTGKDGFLLTIPPLGTVKVVLAREEPVRIDMEMEGEPFYSSDSDVTIAYFYQYFQDGKLTTSTGSVGSRLG
jgi:hypothetical protein